MEVTERTERIAVSLPKALINRIENTRQRLKLNRSKFFFFAIVDYLDHIIEDQDKRLEKAYREVEKADKELLAHFNNSYKNLPVYE